MDDLAPDGAVAAPNEEADPRPKVTPWILTNADSLCTRRLHGEYTGAPRTRDPFTRGRIRTAVIDAIRTFHETGSLPPTPPPLEAEEQRVVAHAVGWYEQLWGDDNASIEAPIEDATELPRRDVRLGGLVDLCVHHADGSHELRQLAFGARDTPASPLDLPATRLAILRLAQVRWIEDETLTIAWCDLLTGATATATVAIPADLAALATWLDERLDIVRTRIEAPVAEVGRDCTTCAFIPHCPALGVRGKMWGSRADRFPEILSISPTTLDAWYRCRRELGNRVLAVPPSDLDGGTAHGLYLHQMLRFVHERGSCRDAAAVSEVLESHGADERVFAEVRRHVAKCPRDADALGHEVEWVRASPEPPVFVASARFDALWRVGDALEVRDYKTGARAIDVIADDPRARVQAWVVAPRAAELGLRVRVRYEHLAREVDEDPEPWEPDDDDLAAVDAELRAVVTDMRAERDWHGVNDEVVCRFCRYRSICPDSATPSEPRWPAVAG